jgi:IS605 OrfB family transposase
MIRASKHSLTKHTNTSKIYVLDELFVLYKKDLIIYINYIVDGVLPKGKNLSSKDLPIENISHSRYRQLIYKQASEIIRSQLKQSKERRFIKYQKIYSYFANNGRQTKFVDTKFSKLKLKDIMNTKFFTVPTVKNVTINLDERFFDISYNTSFDGFIKIILPIFNEKGTRALNIKVPFNHHKHSKKFRDNNFTLRKVIQLKQIGSAMYANLVWEKEIPLVYEGIDLGIDVGYRKLIATSEGQLLGTEMTDIYKSIVNKEKNSKNYKKGLRERDNLIKTFVAQIELQDVRRVMIEDLRNVKYKSEFHNTVNDLLARWTYRPLLERIIMTCEAKGIVVVKVSPQFTSQTCCKCGSVHKESRNRDEFKCIDCGYTADADYNAAVNIRNKGAIVPLSKKPILEEIFH